MLEDMQMAEDYVDADMAVEYDPYDYEMQEDPTPQDQMQEYDMDQADYGDAMVAETPAGMAEEAPQTVDVPIVDSEPAAAVVSTTDVPIPTEPIPPPSIEPAHPVPAVLPTPQATITEIPPSTTIPLAALPTTLPPFEPQPVHTTPPQPESRPELVVIPENIIPPTDDPVRVPTPDATEVPIVVSLEEESPTITHVAEVIEEVPGEAAAPAQSGEATVIQEPSTATHEQQPEQPLSEAVESLPLVTLYSDDQPFTLFFASDGEAPAPVLLHDRFDLYTAPLAELLSALQVTQHESFAGVQGCVLGLEYQALDLTIDANCKYASTYTLKHLCDALIACNHLVFDFNLYQVTDFETSLRQRLQGTVPDYVVASSVKTTEVEAVEESTAAPAEESITEEVLYDETATDQAHPEVDENDDAPEQPVVVKQAPTNDDSAVHQEDHAEPTIEQLDEAAEAEYHEEYDEPAAEAEEPPILTHVEEAGPNEPLEATQESHADPAELGDADTSSSATLESSAHGEPPADNAQYADASAESVDRPVDDVEAQGEAEDEFGSDYDPNEYDDNATQDYSAIDVAAGEVDELAHDDDAAEPEQDELEEGEEQGQVTETAVHDEAPVSTKAAALGAASTSASSADSAAQGPDGAEYEEYADYEDELETAAEELPSVDSGNLPPPTGNKTSPGSASPLRNLSGKRDREEDDLSEYDVDDLGHESDTKRARVE